jgi:hypothetical protein
LLYFNYHFLKLFQIMPPLAVETLSYPYSLMPDVPSGAERGTTLQCVKNGRLTRFLAMTGLLTGLGTGMISLSGCGEEPPREHTSQFESPERRAPRDSKTGLRKESEAAAPASKKGSTSGGCNETGSNALGVMLGMAAAVSLIARAVPGKSLPERLVSGGIAVAGAAVGTAAICGGAEPTVILAGATVANGLLAAAAAIPPTDSK